MLFLIRAIVLHNLLLLCLVFLQTRFLGEKGRNLFGQRRVLHFYVEAKGTLISKTGDARVINTVALL